MLSFLLLILKIIGIILAVILCVLLLILCIILFVPFCYETWGQCLGNISTLKLKGTVYWLFRLIQVDAYYKEDKYKIRIRIAWKKITKGRQIKEEKTEEETPVDSEMSEEELNELLDLAICEKQEKNVDNLEEKPESRGKTKDNSDKITIEEAEDRIEDKAENKDKGIFIDHTDEKEDKKKNHSKNVFEKIKYTLKKSCDKMKEVIEKKNKIMAVITDDTHIKAVLKVKSELIRVFRKTKPKICRVQMVFGCEDPKNTGDILAFLSILYPFLGEEFFVTPDFNNQRLKGKAYLKGKIRVSILVGALLRLLLNKNIRNTYKDMKSFEL